MPARKAKEWTAAGAARFAREARISTAQFLASSLLAPLWELSKVRNSYGYHQAHLGDHDAAMDVLLGGLGYQRPYPQGWNAIAEMLVTDEARYPAEAELYVLSPHMCTVVTAAALTLTRGDLQQLGEEDLPSPPDSSSSPTHCSSERLPVTSETTVPTPGTPRPGSGQYRPDSSTQGGLSPPSTGPFTTTRTDQCSRIASSITPPGPEPPERLFPR